ncbi:hypothetical protein VTK73DRAFT_5515 [Phialemonium thermophilum]|uniref:Uncharacterized protein n=1 Tax=Phialemonium thermophilum TaxID=223376 RepID=A0ABR3V1F3_9PEZI
MRKKRDMPRRRAGDEGASTMGETREGTGHEEVLLDLLPGFENMLTRGVSSEGLLRCAIFGAGSSGVELGKDEAHAMANEGAT